MLSTESRMRGDMQVRFGGRYGKTYCRKAVRRSVPSLRAGKGGNLIALAKDVHIKNKKNLHKIKYYDILSFIQKHVFLK